MIIIETVGVGQDEVDIVRAAHTTVVVSAPGLGDDTDAVLTELGLSRAEIAALRDQKVVA